MAKPIAHYGRWRIRWLDEKDVRHSEVYDSYREAEAALRKHQHEVDEIREGLRSSRPPVRKFEELCAYYLTHRSAQKRRPRDDESMIRVHLKPYFGSLNLTEIGAGKVEEYKASKVHLHRKTVHHHLTLLISMLKTAHDLGWITKEPKIKKPRLRLFERDFSYLRSASEIDRFLRSAFEEDRRVYAIYSCAVYTGMRAGEIAGLRWEDIDFDRRLIAVQRSYTGLTKAGDVRYVPILNPLLPVLKEWRLACSGQLVFPNLAGKMLRDSDRVFQETLHRVLVRAGFPSVQRNNKERAYITFHQLRHSFASNWVMRGGDLFKLQKILGHKSMQMTSRYSHLCPDAFTEDHSRLGPAPTVMSGELLSFPSAHRP